ncbi:hypothetical protein BG000_004404, partial [Podila horticola]
MAPVVQPPKPILPVPDDPVDPFDPFEPINPDEPADVVPPPKATKVPEPIQAVLPIPGADFEPTIPEASLKIPKPVQNRDAADKKDKDKAIPQPVVIEIGVENTHTNIIPTILPIVPVQTPVEDIVEIKPIEEIRPAPPVAPAPTTVPAPVASVAAQVDKDMKKGAKSIRDAIKSTISALPNVAAPIQSTEDEVGKKFQGVVKGAEDAVKPGIPLIPNVIPAAVPVSAPALSVAAVGTKAKDPIKGAEDIKTANPVINIPTAAIHVPVAVQSAVKSAIPGVKIPTIAPDVAAPIQTAIPNPNAIDDLFGSAKPTLGFVAPTKAIDKPMGAPTTVANRPVKTKAPSNQGEPSRQKHPSPTDDDEVDIEDDKKKSKDSPDNETEDEEEGEKTGDHHPNDESEEDPDDESEEDPDDESEKDPDD